VDCAEPEKRSALAGSFRAGLELTLVGVESLRFRQDGPLAVGLVRTTGTYGLSQGAGIGAYFGLGLTDQLVLGGRVAFAGTSSAYAGASDNRVRFELAPSLEYVFGESDDITRPFIAGLLGLLVGDTMAGSIPMNELSFLLAGQLGLHVFPAPHVSIDPSVFVGYHVGSASADSNAASGAGVDYGVSGVAILLALGISYWS
jgi:hypothetical protein